jgi:transcriptional regulator with XRE-family HTH domain
MAEKINPAMLVLARESKGMTQGELASEISVSQANVSKFESGLLDVSSEQLSKISDALEKPESFFFQPTPQHGFASNCL